MPRASTVAVEVPKVADLGMFNLIGDVRFSETSQAFDVMDLLEVAYRRSGTKSNDGARRAMTNLRKRGCLRDKAKAGAFLKKRWGSTKSDMPRLLVFAKNAPNIFESAVGDGKHHDRFRVLVAWLNDSANEKIRTVM
jgi:hypothetical protein